jgi:hypothetical protein
MQDLTLYYLFLKCNLMHYYFDKILSFAKSGYYMTSSADRWGLQSVHASQNSPRQRLGNRLAHRRSPISCWFLLVYGG